MKCFTEVERKSTVATPDRKSQKKKILYWYFTILNTIIQLCVIRS